MNKITIFLNLGMQGLGTKTFPEIDLNDTLDSFLDIVKNKEGALGVEWIRMGMGKVLTGTRFGKFKLSDLGLYNEITLWAALRLNGGAEQKSQFDAKKVQLFGGSVKYSQCSICINNGLNGALKCGDSYCSACMKYLINHQKGSQAKLSCIKCKSEIDGMLAFEIASFTAKEKAAADKAFFRNGLKLADSQMSECVHCKEIVMKQPLNGNKLSCHKCKKYTCQICKLAWINANANNKQFCGNDVCDPSIMYQTFLDFAQEKEVGGVKVTNTRFCPSCLKVNIHGIACRHITCPCGYQYCHICLQDYTNHVNECKVQDRKSVV